MYIKINEEKYPIKDFQVFTTQMGNNGIRIIGDVPTAEGFLILDDEDNVIADRSDYTYLYREDDKCKEYTAVEEGIIPAECSYMGDIPISPIQRQISALNNRVNELTPYTESKTAGIQDTVCVFDGHYQYGVISAMVVTDRGTIVPNTIEWSDDNITVRFKELEETATVTISIQ